MFDLSDICSLNTTHSVDDANKLQKIGWVLLKINQYSDGETNCSEFVLGWSSSKGEPINLPSKYREF